VIVIIIAISFIAPSVVLQDTEASAATSAAQAEWETVIPIDSLKPGNFGTYWNWFYPWGDTHNGNAKMYVDQVTLDASGTATIVAETPDPESGWKYRSGAFHSKAQIIVDDQYPEWDIKGEFKAPVVKGSWPAFWPTGAWNWPPEVDILEFKGDNYNWFNTYDGGWETKKVWISDAATVWHEYRCHLTQISDKDVKVEFYLDGSLVGTHTGSNFVGEPFDVIVNMQMEGSSGSPGPTGKTYYYAKNIVITRNNVVVEPDGWQKVDDSDASIAYSAGWGTYVGSGGYMNTEHWSETTDATATFSFTGTQARYYGFMRSDLGKVNIYVDGTYVTTLDLYSSTFLSDYLLFETDVLPLGSHTLKVELDGSKNPSSSGFEANIDAFSWIDMGGGGPVNTPPTADFSFTTSELTADFTDSSTDSDGTIASWSWNFGDGSSSTDQNPSHTYAAADTYTVTLTVTDNDGATDSFSRTITPPQNEIMTWVPPYSIQACQDIVQTDFGEYDAKDGLTRVGLQFWVPNTDGTIKYADHEWYTPDDADVAWWQNWCSTNNIECLLCVYNNDGSFNWDLARSAFATNRITFVNALISEMERLNLDGIDIDLEGIGDYEDDRGAFDQFIHDLWVELDARGKVLTIDSFHYIWNAPNHNWWSDWLGEVDNIHSMGYDDLYEGGTTWHKYSFQQNAGYAAGYAGNAVLMGFPSWMDSWGTSSGRGTSAIAHVQEIHYDLTEPTGIAIWDLQLSASAWQESNLWGEIAGLKSAEPTPQSPFYGYPQAIPGQIEAEDFDFGAEGVAYHDYDAENQGGAYRPSSGVDIEACSEGDFNVGYMCANEWLEYTVDVVSAGTYTIEIRVASLTTGGTFHIEFDGVDKTGNIDVPVTDGWQNWVSVTATVDLSAGVQVMKFVNSDSASDEYNINYYRFLATGDNAAPAANFTFTTMGLTAIFTDTSTDSDGTIASWAWSFGDGSSSTAKNPSHTYATDGTYTVWLTVTDNDGATDSFNQGVTVTVGQSASFLTQPYLQSVHTSGITIMWELPGMASCSVDYGLDTSYGSTNGAIHSSSTSGDTEIYKSVITGLRQHRQVKLISHLHSGVTARVQALQQFR
jgi:PKD repeat protein